MPTGTLDVARCHLNRADRSSVVSRAAHPNLSSEFVASSVASAHVHPVLRLQHLHGNQHVQRLIDGQRRHASPASLIARKAPDGGSCSSAPSEEEAVQAQAQQEEAQGQEAPVAEEETVMAMSVNRVPLIQRYVLAGFPTPEKAKMEAAIPVALDTVENCDDIGWVMTKSIKSTLRGSIYVYKPDSNLCGWTFPMSPYIEVGKTAFDPSHCCKLESTLAHEASHVNFKTESGAREMEKDCFSCG
jgi:hypothetical protein